MKNLEELFNNLIENDKKFCKLVLEGYEVTPHLIFNTDLDDEECNEMEILADKTFKRIHELD